ncbi:Exocyst subunit exo70 family protein G1 [Hibiscus syriacus]|uniref:Exocyst subunit exo70 family protein G1 n=1 Tax=Hibiscus syriacus TaxID=106335 RepID=A0A6A3D169_HIBSY|nr:uncharacterized protein LOC120200283 [Hibiscus syriacus]KAE8735196.1 Exocyst subunit exo70 family protein G1 [Hibiscus syriacus]
MEVMVGPTFGIEVAPSPAYSRDNISSSACLFIKDEVGGGSDPRTPDLSSDTSSSIGSPGDSDVEDEEEDGVVSSAGLASLSSVEDSLPIKRRLSNHYAGKSKSFGNLSDISSVKEVPKVESPFNKRRRLLLANKWSRSRKSSFYSSQNPNSMPLLALVEDDDEDTEIKQLTSVKPKLQQSNLRASFKSQSCFSLTDLHVQAQEEEHQ